MLVTIRCLALLITLVLFAGTAASFELVADSGESADYGAIVDRDDWTLVIVWAHDCMPCEAQKPMLSEFNREHVGSGISVIGVSSDDVSLQAQARMTLNKTPVSFRNYLYDGTAFEQDYQAQTGADFIGTPTYLVHAPDGELAKIHVGPITRADLDRYFEGKKRDKAFTPSADVFR